MRRTKHNFWLDVTLFVCLLITTVTGFVLWRVIPHALEVVFLGWSRGAWVAAHVGSGLMGLAGVVLHVVWHWDWLKALRGRPLRELPLKVRANRVVDRILWMTFIATNVFGVLTWALPFIVTSQGVGVPERLHVAFGVAWTVFELVHLGLHKTWIVATARRWLPVNWPRAQGLQRRSR